MVVVVGCEQDEEEQSIPFLRLPHVYAPGLVSDLQFATLKMPDPTSHCTRINGLLPLHTVQAPVIFCETNPFGGKKFYDHCVLRTCL
jgi:hypothetical protein